MSERSVARRFASWWIDDLPPVTPRLRVVFLVGALVLALVFPGTPMGAPAALTTTDPAVYTPTGLVALLHLHHLGAQGLAVVRVLTLVAWVCAIAGLAVRLSLLTTALGFAILQGVSFGAGGMSNHTWFVAWMALFALAFSSTEDVGLDKLLTSKSSWYRAQGWLRRGGPLSRTGFARKLLLACLVHMYFSGGVAKLLASGFAWADGSTLRTSIAEQQGGSRVQALADLVVHNPWLASLLGVGTLVFELGSPLALFSRRARTVFAVSALLFHVMSAALLLPVFLPQLWCFILVVDWKRTPAPTSDAAPPMSSTRPMHRWAIGLASLASALLLVASFARKEAWPLTYVHMYSAYRAPDRWGPATDANLDDIGWLRAHAREVSAANREVDDVYGLCLRLALARVDDDGARHEVELSTLRGAYPAQWRWVLCRVAMQSLAREDASPRTGPAATLLDQSICPAMKRSPKDDARGPRGEKVELVFRQRTTGLVLGECSLAN